MNQRTLGKTGREVSEIGFGAWAIGDAWGDLVPEEEARGALHAALDAGMNFIDTADVYGAGRSEEIIGRVLKERSEEVFVATKMGRSAGWTDDLDSIRRAAEIAIARLGVDALDLVQLHCIPTATLKAGKAFANLEKIKEEGLIRAWGVSIETIEEGLFCIQEGGAASLQVIFNIFRQRVLDELLPAAAESGVGIIARVPLASGLLTGKFGSGHRFNDGDHRHFNCDGQIFNVGETFAGVPFETGVALSRKIETMLDEHSPHATLAQKSLRWILDHPAVSTVIPGAKSAHQALENVAAAALPPLGAEAHAQLRALYDAEIDAAVRGVY